MRQPDARDADSPLCRVSKLYREVPLVLTIVWRAIVVARKLEKSPLANL